MQMTGAVLKRIWQTAQKAGIGGGHVGTKCLWWQSAAKSTCQDMCHTPRRPMSRRPVSRFRWRREEGVQEGERSGVDRMWNVLGGAINCIRLYAPALHGPSVKLSACASDFGTTSNRTLNKAALALLKPAPLERQVIEAH